MKTLYVSDLDGTLLRSDVRLSKYTCDVIDRFVNKGGVFSYATARSLQTASVAAEGIRVRIPVIVHNGVEIADSFTRRPLYSLRFSKAEKEEIFSAFLKEGLMPLTYSYIADKCRFSYFRSRCSKGQWDFILSRFHDERGREIFAEEQALDGEVYYFACIDEENHLRPVYDAMKEKYRCYFARDIYSGDMWLEISRKEASKANAALRLKEMLHCDRIVCFGDETNDIPLFEISDESYAVANAAEALKEIATGVIASNDQDGVAHWLEKYGKE